MADTSEILALKAEIFDVAEQQGKLQQQNAVLEKQRVALLQKLSRLRTPIQETDNVPRPNGKGRGRITSEA